MNEDNKTLQHFTLDAIAEMICGDGGDICFPYRTSSQLTAFFKYGLGLPYVHNGSTRKWWVLDVLKEQNQKGFNKNNIISDENIRVLQSIFDIKYFITNGEYKHFLEEKPDKQTYEQYDKAIINANRVLKHSGIEITRNIGADKVKISSLDKVVLSTEPTTLKIKKKFEFCPVVFHIPDDLKVNPKLVSVMMPFKEAFKKVYEVICYACCQCGIDCKNELMKKFKLGRKRQLLPTFS